MTSKIIFDQQSMQIMAMFEKMSRATIKDCIMDDNQAIFIVAQGEVGKAVGPKGANIKKMEKQLNKRVKVAEYSDDVCQFVANLCMPAKVKQVTLDGKIVKVEPADIQSRGFIIGRNASTLRKYEGIVKRYFEIDEIKVLGV